ncbi:hypothetical protein TM51_14551 [Thermobifida fusca TM51]|uniref:DUF1449 family protein n=1 Tax=Thermobifida fusca TM51 TaxID=1169414 RepID=A0A9P2WQ33_THEFU|nr:OB-fold-containig protein [Thermobifida fusca]EOR70113.1 hypothetical protein TM51_14551 [Thermobifida fusca TM51]
MSDFVTAALAFPTALFSFALVVVACYWCLVIIGALGVDTLDPDVDGTTELGGLTAAMSALGLHGVPVTVSLSTMIAVAWFVSLSGTVLLDRFDLSDPLTIALGILLLAIALVCAWAVTSALALAVRRFLPDHKEPSRHDFIGRVCVVRTGRVDRDFGQAEVTAADGSTALIQVRQTGEESLTAGSTALIVDYAPEGSFFWVTAYHAELDPHRS